MLAQTHSVLSNSIAKIMGSGSATKALAGTHPVAFGIAVGISAYFIIDKYWLSKDNDASNSDTSIDNDKVVSGTEAAT